MIANNAAALTLPTYSPSMRSMTSEFATALGDIELLASCAERAMALGWVDRSLVKVLDGLLGLAQNARSKMSALAQQEPSLASLRDRSAAAIERLERALAATKLQ